MATKRIINLDTTAEIRDDDIFLPLDSSLDGTNKVSVGNVKQYILNAVKELETIQLKALIGFEMFLVQDQRAFVTLGRKTYARCAGTRTGVGTGLSKALYPDYYEYVRLGVEQGYTNGSTNIKLPPSRINTTSEVCYTPAFDGEYLVGMGVKSGTFGYVNGGIPHINFSTSSVQWNDNNSNGSPFSPEVNTTLTVINLNYDASTINYGSSSKRKVNRISYSSRDNQGFATVTGNKPLVDALQVNMYVLVKIED